MERSRSTRYLCPSGTIAGIIEYIKQPIIRSQFGWLFNWKLILLGIILISSLIVYRSFCKYLCPLGAFYGFFNRVSLVRMHLDESKCVHCSACAHACKMNVDPSKKPNSMECIRCGDFHFHTHCEQGFGPLSRTIKVIEEKFGDLLIMPQITWLNLGGGHHITKDDYDREGLISEVKNSK